jgi:hypothetical protein
MESGQLFPAISRAWRSRVTESHEYTIIRNDSVFSSSFHTSFVPESQFDAARGQLAAWCAACEGSTLPDVFSGHECETYEGPCYCITSREPLALQETARMAVRDALLADLTLVHGIGRRKARDLKQRGYATVRDLTMHRKFGKAARETLAILSGTDPGAIERLVSRWHSPSHPAAFLTSGLYPSRDFLFIDLETLGFFSRPIILFGLAEVRDQELVVSQYLLRDIGEELPALSAFFEHLGDDRVIVSYNGKAFDVPYLAGRSAFYGRPAAIANPHYDLLHFSRRRWRDQLPDCRLVTLEEHLLGIHRGDDIPGAMVPEFYEAFLTTGNPGPLVPIVTHNRQDLVSLARLFCLLQGGCT